MWPFIIAFTISLLVTPLVIKFYRSRNWLDDPKKLKHAKKTHSQAVPRGGGLVIYIGILLTSIFFLQIERL